VILVEIEKLLPKSAKKLNIQDFCLILPLVSKSPELAASLSDLRSVELGDIAHFAESLIGEDLWDSELWCALVRFCIQDQKQSVEHPCYDVHYEVLDRSLKLAKQKLKCPEFERKLDELV
jgi:hypothetical protein